MGIEGLTHKDQSGRMTVSLRYDPAVIEKIRTIQGRRWHPVDNLDAEENDGTKVGPW